MKKIYPLLFASLLTCSIISAQTTAMDFTMNDCNGQIHNLYNELDSENVVIMEFFMTSCQSCIDAGNDMKPMHLSLVSQYGNKVRFFQTGFNNTYSCATVLNWVSTNGFTSVPFDSGAAQVAYYGGMGMPTIAVAAGSAHKLLFSNVGFATSDTTIIGAVIRNFLDSTLAGIQDINTTISANIFPNPPSESFVVSLNTTESGILKMELTNTLGEKLSQLAEEKIQSGTWKRNFSISLPNGIYFIKGSIDENIFYQKITVLH